MSLLQYLPPPPQDKYGWPWTEETDPDLYSDKPLWPKITILSINFNQSNYLEESIRSVLLQNYPNLEYRILDSASTDNSKEIIGKYKRFLTSCESIPKTGIADLISYGVTLCSGEIFNWINADDYYNPRTFCIVANAFAESPNIHLVSGRYQFYTDDNSLDEIIPKLRLSPSVGKMIAGHFNQPATFFTMEPVKKIMPLNNSLKYTGFTELWIKYLLAYGTGHILSTEDILTNSRNHDKLKSEIKDDDFFRKRNSSPAVELNSIFYSIAEKFRFTAEAEIIKKLSDPISYGYLFPLDTNLHQRVYAKSIIDNYLFRHGLIFYQEGNVENSHQLFKCINPDSLEKSDRRLFRKLILKSFFSTAIKLKRKIVR